MNERSMHWFEQRSRKDSAGAALVIHGLNLRPDKMESIIAVLNETGYDALNLSLNGHGTNYLPCPAGDTDQARLEAFKSVTSTLWKAEALAAYSQIQSRAARKKQTTILVGFSMGALLGLDLFASQPDVHFEKLILFAPALKLHSRNHLIRLLAAFPRLVIPSRNCPDYLANRGTPMAAYNTFFEILAHFPKQLSAKVDVPALVFIDPRDEIVSHSGLQELVDQKKWDRWQIQPVRKGAVKDPKILRHLVIDEASTGANTWQHIADSMQHHLSEP
jgi:alpha-beta hydrolase superfamily lysophospholipase